MSEPCEDDLLDIAIEKGEIVKCIRKLKQAEVMEWANYWLGNALLTRGIVFIFLARGDYSKAMERGPYF